MSVEVGRAVSSSLSVHHLLRFFATLLYNGSETPCAWWETERCGGLSRWIKVSLARVSLPRLGVAVEDTVLRAGGRSVSAWLSCRLPNLSSQHRSRRGSRVLLGWGTRSLNVLAACEPLSARQSADPVSPAWGRGASIASLLLTSIAGPETEAF